MKFGIRLSHHTAVVLLHDAVVFGTAFLATGILDGAHNLTREALAAAAITAVKVAMRSLFPAPAALVDLEQFVAGVLAARAMPASAVAPVGVPTPVTVVVPAPAPVVAPVAVLPDPVVPIEPAPVDAPAPVVVAPAPVVETSALAA